MPTGRSAKGTGGVMAMPGLHPQCRRTFRSFKASRNATLSGTTRDSAGSALGGCMVLIFRTVDNSFVAQVVSDIDGLWAAPINLSGPFFVVAYKIGTPDESGVSVNTLLPI